MPNEKPAPDLVTALLDRRAAIDNELRRHAARVAHSTDRMAALRLQRVEIDNEVHVALIQNGVVPLPTRAPPSKRNMGILRAWSALRHALLQTADPTGIPHGRVKEIIKAAVPGIPESTIRSHLYRLKKRGLIKQCGRYWQLCTNEQHLIEALPNGPAR